MEGGFTRAVQQLLSHLDSTRQFKTSVTDNGVDTSLEEEKTIILFRIFQEVINNIIHHAKAKTIDVFIEKTQNGFDIKVLDDGQGFDSKNLERNHGLGFSNMQQRAALIGARLTIDSTEGKGTEVIINVQTETNGE